MRVIPIERRTDDALRSAEATRGNPAPARCTRCAPRNRSLRFLFAALFCLLVSAPGDESQAGGDQVAEDAVAANQVAAAAPTGTLDIADSAEDIVADDAAAEDAVKGTVAEVKLTVTELADVARSEEEAAFAGGNKDADDSADAFAAAEDDAPSSDALPAERAVGDELWFVSARRARCTDGEVSGLDYWRYDDAGRWRKASLEELVAADPKIPTCFHVHGNRVSLCEANYGGWQYYSIFTGAGCRERGPLRWVIFSWPSDRINCKSRVDVQVKAVRAECYGYYLAWVVDKLSPDAQVSMVGYSFGTRLIGSSLHYLGGGALRGRQLTELQVENRHVRTVMLAAALDNNHFAPGHTMQMAPSQIDRLLLGLNPRDPALKWYALLYEITFRPRRGQQALGHSGVACVLQLNGRVEQRDMSCPVGREHDTHGFHYLTPGFVERMRTYVYFEDVTTK